jgi:ParB-like nuclease domain
MNTITKVESASELRRITLEAITIDRSVQQRVAGTSQEVVEDYACAMRDGDAFPPLIVFSDEGLNYYIADGFHRLEAYKLARPEAQEIECEVHPGDRYDAIIWACGANTRHGLRRSGLDKLKAVTTLFSIDKCSSWSDRLIARHVGVSHPFVAKVRREHLEKLPDASRKDEDQAAGAPAEQGVDVPSIAPDRRRTVMRGGKPYRMRTARIGGGRAAARSRKKAEPPSSLDSLAWSTATPQERVAFVKGVGRRGIEDAFNAIKPNELTLGFDTLNRAWKAAKQPERQEFAKQHFDEISSLAGAPGPAMASERSAGALSRDTNPDDDPLAIPTFLRRKHPTVTTYK